MDIDFDSMDEEVAAQVRAALDAKDGELKAARAAADRRDAIYTDAGLAAKFPRSIHALRTKLVAEPDLAGEQLTAWLETKEKEYVAIGAPEPGKQAEPQAEPQAQPQQAQPAAETQPDNPAVGWGPAAASGQAPAINLTADLKDVLASGQSLDADTIIKLDSLNKRDDGRKSIRELTYDMMDKRPLI